MWSTIGWIVLWLFSSLVVYVIVEGIFHGGWRDPDVKGVRALLRAMFSWIIKRIWQILCLFGQTIRFLIRWLKNKSPRVGKWCWGNSKKITRGAWKGFSRATRTIKKPSWVKTKKTGLVIGLSGAVLLFIIFLIRWWLTSQSGDPTPPTPLTTDDKVVAVLGLALFIAVSVSLIVWLARKVWRTTKDDGSGEKGKPAGQSTPSLNPPSPTASKSKLVWGLVIVGVIITLLTVGWKPISDWWIHPASSTTTGASKVGDQWKACWMEEKGTSAAKQNDHDCNEVTNFKNNNGITHIEVSYKSKSDGLPHKGVANWNQQTGEGYWVQEEPPWHGKLKLIPMSSDLFSGKYTNEVTGGEGIMILKK